MTHLLAMLAAAHVRLDAAEESLSASAPLSALTLGAPAPVGAQGVEGLGEEEWSAPAHGHPPVDGPMHDPPTHSGKVVS